jgi:hypothetical protein
MKRILAIDGGGIRGVFPAAFLASLEEKCGRPIGEYFDLIAGTSTGGIIAIGLGMGNSAKEILELYESEGPAIFAQERTGVSGWLEKKRRLLRHALWGPKYESDALQQALTNVFGEKRLGDSKARLLIPSWHAEMQKVYIFKTAHHERLQTDFKELAVDAALATSSAPTYFRQHLTKTGVGLVDGGIWANNPTGLAVVEAIGMLGWQPSELKVLSIGCLEDIANVRDEYGVAGFLPQMTNFFMAGQSHGSMGIAHILTGDRHDRRAIHRISQPVVKGFFSLDDTSKIKNLKSRAIAEARDQFPILASAFFTNPAQPFEPIYRNQ